MANVIGQRVRRKEDPRFLKGEGRYVDNMPLEDALHLTYVRSPVAHARITGIDVSEARALPGVQVFTADDIELGSNPPPPFLGVDERMHRPFVAKDTVRFAGDIVACILTDTQAAGADAAELVYVDYEDLPVVTDPREAVKDEVVLFPDVGTNVCIKRPPEHSDEELFDGCEITVEGTLVSQRLAASPLEPRCLGRQVRGRQAHRLALHPDAAPGPEGLAMNLGMERRSARDRPGRGRRLRRQGPERRGHAGRLAGPRARPHRALDRDAQREHGGDEPGPRAGDRLQDRRHPRRQGGRLRWIRAPGRRRLPGHRRVPAQPHRH